MNKSKTKLTAIAALASMILSTSLNSLLWLIIGLVLLLMSIYFDNNDDDWPDMVPV